MEIHLSFPFPRRRISCNISQRAKHSRVADIATAQRSQGCAQENSSHIAVGVRPCKILHSLSNNWTLCYQCPLTGPYMRTKMVLGPPKRYGIQMVKKWYGQFQRGLPKDGRYCLEMVVVGDHFFTISRPYLQSLGRPLWNCPYILFNCLMFLFLFLLVGGGPKTVFIHVFGNIPNIWPCRGTWLT